MKKIEYSEYKKIIKSANFKYIDLHKGLPYGAIRVYTQDEIGEEHSIVLTKSEYIKYFGRTEYIAKTQSYSKPNVRLSGKPWFEYNEVLDEQD